MMTNCMDKSGNSIYFKLCCYIIYFLVIICGITPLNIDKYIVLMIITIIISFLKYYELKKITYLLLPLSTLIHGYVVLFALLLLIIKSKSLNKYQLIPTIVILTIESIHFLFLGKFSLISDFVLYCSYITMFFYLLFDNKTKCNFENLSLFCYSCTIILFIVVYNMISTFGVMETMSGIHRDGSIMGSDDGENVIGAALNANSVGYFSLIVITLLFVGNRKLKMPLYLYILSYIIAIVAGIISFSRTWIILVVLSLIMFIMCSNKNISRKIILVIVIGVLLFSMSSINIIQNAYDVFGDRLNGDDIETLGNRTGISDKYIEYMNENKDTWVWGRGSIQSKYINNATIHNAIIQIVFSYGAIGFLTYLVSFVLFFKRARGRQTPKVQYIPFIACFIEIQTLQFLSPPFMMFPILISMQALSSVD